MKAYYDTRAREYDDWWLAEGLHAAVPPEWKEERDEVIDFIRMLPPKRARFLAEARLDELDGGETLFTGRWFVAVRA